MKHPNPVSHPSYAPVLFPSGRDPLSPAVRRQVEEALAARATAADAADIAAIDARIVALTWRHAIRPHEIARDVLRAYHWRGPLSIDQATLVLAAIAEAGYPIAEAGYPIAEARPEAIWAAAERWARLATDIYVSLGASLPRAVQYEEPGRMDPTQQASLTLGPWADACGAHHYIRRHTRRLLLVR